MSPSQFRAIIVGYLALCTLDILLGYLPPRPPAVPKERSRDHMRFKSRVVFHLFGVILLAVAAIDAAGVIGMFVFWPPAPKLFVFAVIAKPVIWPFFVSAQFGHPPNEWQKACSQLAAVLSGVIVAVSLIGSARPLFITP